MKVLVIQHQQHTRRLLSHLFRQHGHDVFGCASVDDALEHVAAQTIDVVCVEDPSPHTRPRDNVRRLRARDELSSALVIALVDREHQRNLGALMTDGADDYLILPAPLEDIQLRLGVVLGWIRKSTNRLQANGHAEAGTGEFFSRMPDAALLIDRQGTVVDANHRIAALTGFSVHQMVGQPAEIIGLPMAEEMPKLIEAVSSASHKLEDVTLIRRDMKPVPVAIRYAWLDPDACTTIMGVAREVDSEPRAPQSRKAEIADEISEPGYLEFDRQGMVRALNSALAGALHLSKEHLMGASLQSLIHREDLSRISELMAPERVGGKQAVTGKLRLRSGSGDWVSLELAGSAPRSPGEPDRFRLEVIDPEITAVGDSRPRTGVDQLTGLVDRQEFIASVRAALVISHDGPAAAIMVVRLDRFKLIHQSYGYEVGDQLIARSAERLTGTLSSDDVVARVGDSEFAILTNAAETVEEAVDLATAIADDFAAQPLKAQRVEQILTVSIGVSMNGTEPLEPAELLRRADAAAVQARAAGGNRVQIYEPALEQHSNDLLRLEQELLQAINRNQFEVLYQPEVDLYTGAIVGLEALVRWNHPEKGKLNPSRFIATAEDAGVINQIGLWVLENAARHAATWIDAYHLDDFTLSVNFSALQFRRGQIVPEVVAVLRRSGLDPSALRVEITESTLVDDEPETLKRITQFRKLGVKLAIDDFGTGHASISNLRTLPVQFLKVDRSFVSGASAMSGELSLTRSISAIAREAGLEVVVEGIETRGQLDRVREYECRYGQGFYFSRPVERSTIDFLLSAGPYPFASLI